MIRRSGGAEASDRRMMAVVHVWSVQVPISGGDGCVAASATLAMLTQYYADFDICRADVDCMRDNDEATMAPPPADVYLHRFEVGYQSGYVEERPLLSPPTTPARDSSSFGRVDGARVQIKIRQFAAFWVVVDLVQWVDYFTQSLEQLTLEHAEIFGASLDGLAAASPLPRLISFRAPWSNLQSLHGMDDCGCEESLRVLDVNGCSAIATIEALGAFSQLREVTISGTSVVSLVPLTAMRGLEALHAAATPIVTLDGLAHKPHLLALSLHDCAALTSLLPLRTSAQGLTTLRVDGATSLMTFEGINNDEAATLAASGPSRRRCLESISANHTGIHDLTGLASIETLTALYCNSCTSLTSLHGLGDKPHLITAAFADCARLRSLVGLERCPNLCKLDLANCSQLGPDVSDFPIMPSLKIIWLSYTPIESLRGLPEVAPAIEEVHVQGCRQLSALLPVTMMEGDHATLSAAGGRRQRRNSGAGADFTATSATAVVSGGLSNMLKRALAAWLSFTAAPPAVAASDWAEVGRRAVRGALRYLKYVPPVTCPHLKVVYAKDCSALSRAAKQAFTDAYPHVTLYLSPSLTQQVLRAAFVGSLIAVALPIVFAWCAISGAVLVALSPVTLVLRSLRRRLVQWRKKQT